MFSVECRRLTISWIYRVRMTAIKGPQVQDRGEILDWVLVLDDETKGDSVPSRTR